MVGSKCYYLPAGHAAVVVFVYFGDWFVGLYFYNWWQIFGRQL